MLEALCSQPRLAAWGGLEGRDWCRKALQAGGRHGRPTVFSSRVAAKWVAFGYHSNREELSTVADDRKRVLLRYVQQVEPSVIAEFDDTADDDVRDAMRQTVNTQVGVLPPHIFPSTYSSEYEHMAQLFFTYLMAGYTFCNAKYRLTLIKSFDERLLGEGALYGRPDEERASQWAPGTQTTGVSGEVLKWDHDSGKVAISARDYIKQLERELVLLQEQVASHPEDRGSSGNAVLQYINGLDYVESQELSRTAYGDAHEAMNTFIHRLLGSSSRSLMNRIQCKASELSILLHYCLVVGYCIRMLEVEFDSDQTLLVPPLNLDSLPPVN